jgi:hypothetical protein
LERGGNALPLLLDSWVLGVFLSCKFPSHEPSHVPHMSGVYLDFQDDGLDFCKLLMNHLGSLASSLTQEISTSVQPDDPGEVIPKHFHEDVSSGFCMLKDLHMFFVYAGTTLTLAVVTGWLLTVANVGDSSAFLDNGIDFLEATTSDQIESNEGDHLPSAY